MGIKSNDSIGEERCIGVLECCEYGRQCAHPEVTEMCSCISVHCEVGDIVVGLCYSARCEGARSRLGEAGYDGGLE